MNRFFTTVLWSMVAVFAACIFAYLYANGPFPHPSIEFGYYGQFNRAQRIVKSLPDVAIADSWQHHDVIMEDFGFTLRRVDGSLVKVDFWENSPQMKLESDDAIRSFFTEQLRE